MKTRQLFLKAMRTVPVYFWFSRGWWKHLLEKGRRGYCSKWHRFWCRAAGHPEGSWWYNLDGNEPDMTCKGCGDDLF